MQRPLLIAVLVQLILLISCGVPKNFQHSIYFEDSLTEAEKNISPNPTLIIPGDRLNINITAINKVSAEAFNAPVAQAATGTSGYLVDSLGNIQLLQLGVVHAAGLTAARLQDSLQQQLVKYIIGPVVTVSISNFKIDMLGEIGHPGSLSVPDGKINILQAITQSGDITTFGRRDNILVIREVNGKREFGRLDISSNHVFESPYFNLQQNDMVYIEPDKTKFLTNDVRTERDFRNFSYVLTALSAVLLVINLFKK